jgi:hypothetical protein
VMEGEDVRMTIAERVATEEFRRVMKNLLVARFGSLPPEVEQAVEAANRETMDTWLQRAATAPTLEEAGIRPLAPSLPTPEGGRAPAPRSKVAEKARVRKRRQTLGEQGFSHAIQTVLVARFGTVPPEVERALAEADRETMLVWARRALMLDTLQEVRILPAKPSW